MKPELLLTQKINDYSTLYIDMDSFFASVEQFYNPKLRDKPVGIATGTTKNASIIAASYRAKQKGIYTGIKVEKAMLLCPDIAIVYDSPNSYRYVHRQIMTILHGTIGNVYARGIDEAYLKIPSYSQSHSKVFALTKAIKLGINNLYNEHINCSIGIASNAWLSKMAASFQKPKSLVLIRHEELTNFYGNLGLKDLNGVGYRLEKRLNNTGIFSPLDMYSSSWSKLSKKFGVNGQKWYLRMRGYEVDLDVFKHQKSLGHQVTLGQFMPSANVEITTVINKIAYVLGKRLRGKRLKAQSVSIELLYLDYSKWSNQVNNVALFDDDSTIISLSKMLLKKLKNHKYIKRISIYLGSLTASNQLHLFNNKPKHENDRSLTFSINSIQNKYSSTVINRAKTAFENSLNLDRVGFAGDLIRETSEKLN